LGHQRRALAQVSAAAQQEHPGIDEGTLNQLSMLRILHAACATALDAFRAADNPVDTQLVIDLEKMVERTYVELQRVAKPS
jgi:hypothetical protein